MRIAILAPLVTAIAMTITGCGAPEDAEGLTAAENRELDEAAAQLDAAQEEAQIGMREAEAAEAAAAGQAETDEPEH